MDKGRSLVSGTNEELKAMISTSEKNCCGIYRNWRENSTENEIYTPPCNGYRKKIGGEDYIIKFENGFNNLANLMEFVEKKSASIY